MIGTMRQLIDERFELVSVLGEGAYGEVYLARDHTSGRDVAVKILKMSPDKPQVVERFLREGELTARLKHPGILQIHSAGVVDGRPYLACELVEGAMELDQAFLGLDLDDRARLVMDAAFALGHAHGQGIVHRDVKPANVLVDRHGRVRVTDFGLAQAMDSERLTRTGAVVGTPLYISPEQVQGEPSAPQSDVWALGLLLYHALCGDLPWDAVNVQGLMGQILQLRIPSPRARNRDCPRGLEAVCLRALDRDTARRYEDGTAFARDLERALTGGSVEAKLSRTGPAARVAVPLVAALLAVGGLTFAVLRSGPRAATIRWADPTRLDWGGEGPVELSGTVVGAPDDCELRIGQQRVPVDKGRFVGQLELPDGDHRLTVEIVHAGEPLGSVTRRVRVDRTPPELEIATPADAVSLKPTFSLSGSVRNGGAPVTVTVGEQSTSVSGRFVFDLKLVSGRNKIEVTASDALGNATTTRLRVWFAPAWYERTPPDQRPSLPLAAALNFGSAAGEYVNDRDGSVLVWVPRPQDGVFPIQTGKRYARFSQGFFVGKFEVTREQFARFCEQTGRRPPREPAWPSGPRHPVGAVSWFDAVAYARWAELRLPTEAEWEYAARSLDGRIYSWGHKFVRGAGNFADSKDHSDPYEFTAPVGSFSADESPYGARDMAGNLFEWVNDWDGAFIEPLDRTPIEGFAGPEQGARRVIKGGGYDHPHNNGRVTVRYPEDPNRRLDHLGFRIARSATD